MAKRIPQILLLLALALQLAACAGNTGTTMLPSEMPDDGFVAMDGFVMGAEPAEADKETAWIPGMYVLTAGAAYWDGIDYMFQLLGDNNGHYRWVMRVTNNSATTRHIDYHPHTWRYKFGIRQNGVLRWLLPDSEVEHFGTDHLVLHPYQTQEYSADWDGRDNHGRPIQGLCDAYAGHNGVNTWILMKGLAWLNGIVH